MVAAALGAEVTVFARNREHLRPMHSLGDNVTALPAFPSLITEHVAVADVPVGGVLGARRTGAVPRTSSQALSTALVPYVLRLAAPGGVKEPALAAGINVANGSIVHPAVREALALS